MCKKFCSNFSFVNTTRLITRFDLWHQTQGIGLKSISKLYFLFIWSLWVWHVSECEKLINLKLSLFYIFIKYSLAWSYLSCWICNWSVHNVFIPPPTFYLCIWFFCSKINARKKSQKINIVLELQSIVLVCHKHITFFVSKAAFLPSSTVQGQGWVRVYLMTPLPFYIHNALNPAFANCSVCKENNHW